MNKKTLLVVDIVLLVAVAGGAFYGGMQYSQSKIASQQQQRMQQFANGGASANGAIRRTGQANGGAGSVSGQILSKDANSITVQIRTGGSKIIFFSTSTQITKSSDGSMEDLQIGQNITVNGTTNQDGSVTAQFIQLRPAFQTP